MRKPKRGTLRFLEIYRHIKHKSPTREGNRALAKKTKLFSAQSLLSKHGRPQRFRSNPEAAALTTKSPEAAAIALPAVGCLPLGRQSRSYICSLRPAAPARNLRLSLRNNALRPRPACSLFQAKIYKCGCARALVLLPAEQ